MEGSLGGWGGERGEDSCYDSELEDESVHRAASRTPSDTLAAEFAEYVTLTTPRKPNQVQYNSSYPDHSLLTPRSSCTKAIK